MTDNPAPKPRQCFIIVEGQSHPEFGYVPSLVTENEAGHQPMTGRGEQSQPWFWGTDYEEAKRTCEKVNAEDFGLDPGEAADIVASSIAASIRQDAARHRTDAEQLAYEDDIARKLGRDA